MATEQPIIVVSATDDSVPLSLRIEAAAARIAHALNERRFGNLSDDAFRFFAGVSLDMLAFQNAAEDMEERLRAPTRRELEARGVAIHPRWGG